MLGSKLVLNFAKFTPYVMSFCHVHLFIRSINIILNNFINIRKKKIKKSPNLGAVLQEISYKVQSPNPNTVEC